MGSVKVKIRPRRENVISGSRAFKEGITTFSSGKISRGILWWLYPIITLFFYDHRHRFIWIATEYPVCQSPTIPSHVNSIVLMRLCIRVSTGPVTLTILGIIGLPTVDEQFLTDMKLTSEYLPKPGETAFSDEQRFLHFLWDACERTPHSLATNFAIPFRRILA